MKEITMTHSTKWSRLTEDKFNGKSLTAITVGGT